MTKREALSGKPYAGNPHVRFDEGEAASTATSRRGSLLYKKLLMMIGAAAVSVGAMLPLSAMADAVRVYDVDDYVQDGLVLHFDGIRNAGATA